MKLLAVALSLVIACSSHRAHAAPVVGDAFFLADAHGADTTLSLAGDGRGFGLVWSDVGSVRCQLFGPGAVLTGGPRTLTTATSEPFFDHSTTKASDPKLVAFESGYAAFWKNSTSLVLPPTGSTLMSWGPAGTLIDRMGITSPLVFDDVSTMLPHDAKMAGMGDGLVTLESHVVTSTGVSGDESVRFYDRAGTNVSSLDVPISVRPPTTLGPVAIASNGSSVLFAWIDNDGLHFGRASRTAVKPVTGAALAQATQALSLASNGSDYLAVWRTDAGSTVAARVRADGTVLDPGVISLDSALPHGPSREIAAVAAAGATYLVLSTGDGENVARGVRITSNGSLLDPAGFPVSMATHVSLSYAGGATWLAALLGEDGIVRGRFIGEGLLPMAPDNVEPPSEADAGATYRDASTLPGSSIRSDGGNDTGTEEPSPTDAGRSGGAQRAAHPESSDSSGCSVVASRHDTSVTSGFFTLLALFRRSRRRRALPSVA